MVIRIHNVIDALVSPVDHLESTVDWLLYGDYHTEVTGIVTAFSMSHYILDKAASLGANLIITHEGVSYSHDHDFKRLLSHDSVWNEKEKSIHSSRMNIFRFHDYWHHYKPDGITNGLLQVLNWQEYVVKHQPSYAIVEIPCMTMSDMIDYIKLQLNIPYVRALYHPNVKCRRIGVLVGYRGNGKTVIPLFEKENLDLVIYGEGPEWETPEYVRDAIYQKKYKALIVLGHAESELSGMWTLKNHLKSIFPNIEVHHLVEKPLFNIL